MTQLPSSIRIILPIALALLLGCGNRESRDHAPSDSASRRRPPPPAELKPKYQGITDSAGDAVERTRRPGNWTVFQQGENQVSEQMDLDGDGRPEQITLAVDRESDHFTLSVNGVHAGGDFVEEIDDPELGVVDLDNADRVKELIVYTQGASDYDEYFLYAYDGRTLTKLGEVYDGLSYTGNGIVLNFERMGFWSREEKYAYNSAARTLVHVPQELYYVGVTGTVGKSFPIYRTREGKDVVANLKEGSKALIVACELRRCGEENDSSCLWYLIRSETGLMGWKQGIDTDTFTDLPWAG